MASLLGSRFCIDSLRSDVTDVQSAIIDIFSHCGPVRFPSWKYPDKVSADLDLTELLDTYDYSDNEEERQVAHVVLLELVIDRLLLFLQGLSVFLEKVYGGSKKDSKLDAPTSTSVGLVVKKYWNRTLQLCKAVQQLQAEVKKTNKNAVHDNQESVVDVQVKPSTGVTGRSKGLSSDECHRACQTYETVFKPCEACHFVQTCLRQAGSEIIAVCNGQQLPSDLSKHVQMLVGVEWMTAQDVARWTGEFNKDLQRIVKHFTDVAAMCAAVKTSLAGEQLATAKLKQELNQCRNDVKLEKETQDIMRKQFDTKLKSAENRTTDRINEFQSRLDDARKKCGELQNNLDQLELKRNQEHREHQLLEEKVVQMSRQLSVMDQLEQKATQLSEHVQDLSNDLNRAKSEYNRVERELMKEKSKSNSISKTTEAMQNKQSSLSQRMNELDAENEVLRVRNAELQETCLKLERQRQQEAASSQRNEEINRRVREERENHERKTATLNKELDSVRAQLVESERCRQLLLDFPDITQTSLPPQRGAGHAPTEPQDVARDMEKQIEANSLRIRALEEQNDKLRTLIVKLLAVADKHVNPGPTYAWDTQRQTDTASSLSTITARGHDWPRNKHHERVLEDVSSETESSSDREEPHHQNRHFYRQQPQQDKVKVVNKHHDLPQSVISHSGMAFVVGHGQDRPKSRSRPSSAVKKQPTVVTVLPNRAPGKSYKRS